MNILDRIRRRRLYNETVGELSRLSDAQLQDIGIHRSAIRRVARENL